MAIAPIPKIKSNGQINATNLSKKEIKKKGLVGLSDNISGSELSAETLRFIEQAPDGKLARQNSTRKLVGRKNLVTLKLDPDVLNDFDELVQSLGYTRTMAIKILISTALMNRKIG